MVRRCSLPGFAPLGLAIALLSAAPAGVVAATVPEQDVVNDNCPGQSVGCGMIIHPAALDDGFDWDHYSFYVTAGTPITVGTDDPGGSPYTDTRIELMNASCSQILASDNDSGPRNYSVIYRYPAPASGIYVLRVHGTYSSEPQPYMAFIVCGDPPTGACCLASGECRILDRVQCSWQGGRYEGDGVSCGSIDCPSAPGNDRCEGAVTIPVPGQGVIEGDSYFAQDDYDPWYPSCTGLPAAGRDVVYRLDLDAGDVVRLRYTHSDADAAIYIVTDCADVGPACVAGADEVGYGQTETLQYAAETPIPGACCDQNSLCVLLPEQACLESGGLWRGGWTDCDPNSCSEFHGACCLPGGDCLESDPWECEQLGGDYLGHGSACHQLPCPQPPGACCFEQGVCLMLSGQECFPQNGYWLGEGTTCDPNPCTVPLGACCHADQTCFLRTPEDCAAEGGQYQGDFVRCEESDCGIPVGACCITAGQCLVLTEQQCEEIHGVWFAPGVSCNPNPCPNAPAGSRPNPRPRSRPYYLVLDTRVDETGGPWRLEYSILDAAEAPESGAGTAGLPGIHASPNPFPSSTRITYLFGGDRPGPTRLEIFDAAGRRVRRLPDGAALRGEVWWDGRDDRGVRLASGVYFLRAAMGGGAITRPLILVGLR